MIVLPWIPLGPDESYYWVWGQNPQLSYFDHPAMTGWMFTVSEFLSLPNGYERFVFILFGHMTLGIWLLLLAGKNKEYQIPFLWIALASPMLGLGSMIATPDVPLLFFWSLSLLVYWKYLEKPSLGLALLLGLALGLGLISKYQMVLLFPSLLLHFILFRPNFRAWPWAHIGIVFAGSAIAASPLFIWNLQNDFSSFRFQATHGFTRNPFELSWVTDYVLGQLLIFFPLWIFLKRKLNWKDSLHQLLLIVALAPLLFFLFSSFFGRTEINWPIAAAPAALVLLLKSQRNDFGRKIYLGVWFGLTAIVLLNLQFRFIPQKWGKLNDPFIYQDFIEKVKDFQPIYYSNYQFASSAWFHFKTPQKKLYQMSRKDFYDSLPETKPKGEYFYLAMERHRPLPDWVKVEYPKMETLLEEGELLLLKLSRK